MTEGAIKQKELDFSTRGERLRLLSRCQLPTSRAKAVLQAIDDAIGSDDSWCISLQRIQQRTGLSRRTVQRGIDDLEALFLIEVNHRFSKTGATVVRLPSRFRIGWANLVDYDPAAAVIEKTNEGPVEVETPRRRCAGGVTTAPGCGHGDRGVVSPRHQGGVTTAPGCGHDDHLPAQSLPKSRPNPPPASDGQGDYLWKTFTDDELRRSVRSEVPELVGQLFDEAVAAKWIDGGGVTRHRFFAACHHVATSDGVKSIRAVLIDRLKRRDWAKGNQDSDEWARAAVRACERVTV